MALLVLRSVGFVCRAKPNVPFVRLAEITRLFNFSFSDARESLRLFELKKMCGGKNKKYRRVGNECRPVRQTGRLTLCPLEIWSVCWSPVKMVCPCFNVQFLVVCSMVAVSSYTCRQRPLSRPYDRLGSMDGKVELAEPCCFLTSYTPTKVQQHSQKCKTSGILFSLAGEKDSTYQTALQPPGRR